MAKTKILICSPDNKWEQGTFESLTSDSYEVSVAADGKGAQLILNKKATNILIIDIETRNFSCLEVIRFIKSQNIHTYIILVLNSKRDIDDYFHSERKLKKLGLAGYLVKSFPCSKLIKLIESFESSTSWKDIELNTETVDIEEIAANMDGSFTSIKITEFFNGNMAIFDLYLRIDRNNYVKFCLAGDRITSKRLSYIITKYQPVKIYFKTEERVKYINYLNDITQKMLHSSSVTQKKKMELIKNSSEKYIEEIYTSGISRDVLNEGLALCDNTYELINKNKELGKMFKEYIDLEDNIITHLYLVSLYSAIIGKYLEWVTKRSFPHIIMGAFVHDLGKLKLPQKIREKKPFELSSEQFELYKEHPRAGVELLSSVKGISEQVLQIVYQHHEKERCNGFPMKISSVKTFPLAKIIGFSNYLANRVIQEKTSVYDVMKIIINEKKDIFDYDPIVVKALLRSFKKDD
jgi:response regulator RpfG family c-di-GMP phosphodiesterase